MFLSTNRSGYTRDGSQHASGPFIVLMQGEGAQHQHVKAVVRHARLSQLGHWMMGSMRLADYKLTLSGSYGADGLLCTVPDDIYCGFGLELPQELYEAWNKGGGHNCSGSEGPLIRKWAFDNIKQLRAKGKLPARNWIGSPNFDGMDEGDLLAWHEAAWKRPKSMARELFPGKWPDSETITGELRRYCSFSLEARKYRLTGGIEHARYIENDLMQRIYTEMPEWAKW